MLTPYAVYRHQPYPYWVKGKVCLLGDAGESKSLSNVNRQ